MIIELLSSQIPMHWKEIRKAGIRSDGIEPELQEDYANTLLTDLIAGKKSCVMSVDSERKTKLIVIFGVMFNQLKKVNYLKVYNVFGLQKLSAEDWQELLQDFIALGKKYNCMGIATEASHEHIRNVLCSNGFKVFTTTMHYYF